MSWNCLEYCLSFFLSIVGIWQDWGFQILVACISWTLWMKLWVFKVLITSTCTQNTWTLGSYGCICLAGLFKVMYVTATKRKGTATRRWRDAGDCSICRLLSNSTDQHLLSMKLHRQTAPFISNAQISYKSHSYWSKYSQSQPIHENPGAQDP